MGLPPLLDFRSTIRTHACVVGVLLTLDSLSTLLITMMLHLEEDKLPEEIRKIKGLKVGMLVLGIINSFFTSLYWIGFLKRVRWCLIVVIGFLAVTITLQFIGLLGAMLQLNLTSVCVMLIVLAINGYVLLVTLQLHKVNSEIPVPQQGVSV